MAMRRERIPFKPRQQFLEEPCCLAGMVNDHFTVTVGPVTLALTKEERDRTLSTWCQLESGIDPETGVKFTEEKLAEFASLS